MKRINLNTVLLALGGLAVFAPDVAALASVLQGWGVTWLAVPIRVLGAAALLLSSLPRIIGRLRPLLAALNLATPGEPPAASERPKDGGYLCPCFWVICAIVVACLLGAAALLWSREPVVPLLLVGGQATLWRPAP